MNCEKTKSLASQSSQRELLGQEKILKEVLEEYGIYKTLKEERPKAPSDLLNYEVWELLNEVVKKTQEQMRKKEKLLKDRIDRFHNFIEALESYTDNFDKFCDCDYQDRDGVHLEECQTMNIRRDIDKLFKENKE